MTRSRIVAAFDCGCGGAGALALLVLLGTGWAECAWKAALAGLLIASAGGSGASSGCRRRWFSRAPSVGVVFALFRIVWLIVAAVFLYDITVVTGQFEVMKASVARLSADRRLQAVLVAFCFGAFIEGRGRLRRAGRHLGGLPGRTGIPTVPGGLALFDRQHRTGGLGKHRHPDPHPEQGHRASMSMLSVQPRDGSSPSFRF